MFGDQKADCYAFLKHVFCIKGSIVLSSFLGRVSTALREEVFRQPRRLYHEAIPIFDSVHELMERRHASDQLTPAVESAIGCLAHLSHSHGECYRHHSVSS